MPKYGAYIEMLAKKRPTASGYGNSSYGDSSRGLITYAVRIGPLKSGYREKGWIFASTKLISQSIEEFSKGPNYSREFPALERFPEIGKICIGVHPEAEAKILETQYFFPFDEYRYKWYNANRLKKTGLASLLELQVYKDLAKQYPGFKVVSNPNSPCGSRKIQVHKQGRRIGKPIPIEEAILLLKRYVVTKYREHAGLPPLKNMALKRRLLERFRKYFWGKHR